jgi:uncharacterized membrane protein YhiD involved in acid resistance
VIDYQTVALRLGIALAFGAVIGIEREWRQKQAGLKTMSLVALGSAVFAMMSDTFGDDNHNPGQIAAAVVGGIGFLGAGVIMHRGLTVQGLTTAATLWASSSVGVASGLGQYAIVVLATTLIVAMQIAGRGIEQRIRRVRRRALPSRFEVRVEFTGDALPALNDAYEAFGAVITRSVQHAMAFDVMRVVLRAEADSDISALQEKLFGIAGVQKIDLRHLKANEDA